MFMLGVYSKTSATHALVAVGVGLPSRPCRTTVQHRHREVLRRMVQHRGDLSVQI